MKALLFIIWLMSQQETPVKAKFLEMQDEGTVVFQELGEFSEPLYTLHADGKSYPYAHESEILDYIKTGTFKYNDFLSY